MTEVESKSLEEDHETVPADADKENVAPTVSTEDDTKSTTTNQPEKDEEQKDVAVSTESAAKTDSKPDPKVDAKPDPETEAKPDTDPSAVDLSVYTEDKLYDDMKALLDSGDLNPETVSKKKFREALSTKYSLGGKGKVFKKHDPFKQALDRVIAELTGEGDDAAESEKKEKSKKSKKDKTDKKKKSRKRKRPTSGAEEDEAEDEGHPDPPTKKRKIDDKDKVDGDGESDKKKGDKHKEKVEGDNDGDEEQDGDGDDDDDDEEMKDDGDSKKTGKSRPKKKGQKAPHEWTLTKLKKLARAVGLANPKMYGKMKEMKSNKKRVDFLKELLTEHDVAFDNLSDKTIEKLKEEYALKKEMEELGIGKATEQELECEDGVPLSCRRPRRKRKEVNYRNPAPKYGGDDDDDEEEDGNADGNEEDGGDGAAKKKKKKETESEEEYEEEESEEEEESDAYQPSDVDDDDY